MLKSFLENKKIKKKSKPQKTPIKLDSNQERLKNSACYVLITCNEPNEEGKMHVEMTYEGDSVLAAYLLENAQTILDERNLCEYQ